jgi:2-methylisocitrate lyase-like PEP mutase family enzyme
MAGAPTVAELADLGVARISVGGAFAYTAIGALVEAARELKDNGTYGYQRLGAIGREITRSAFPA